MRHMSYVLLTLLIGYIAVAAFMFVFQRKLMYHPEKPIEAPAHYGLTDFSEYFAPSTDNVTIQLWYRPANPGFPTIIYYHGNAYNIGGRAGIYNALAQRGFGVLAVSYRGYGKSTGSPTEQGLYADARAAIKFLTEQQHIPVESVILFGESLGTGVATQMATEYNVSGLVLEAAYTSVVGRAYEIYPFIPVPLLIHDKYDSIDKIAQVKAPLLLFHGELDATIPIAHGKKLFAAATSPKQAFYFPQVGHYDFDTGVISEHVLDFAKQYKLIH